VPGPPPLAPYSARIDDGPLAWSNPGRVSC
jgi:hypothetical protein